MPHLWLKKLHLWLKKPPLWSKKLLLWLRRWLKLLKPSSMIWRSWTLDLWKNSPKMFSALRKSPQRRRRQRKLLRKKQPLLKSSRKSWLRLPRRKRSRSLKRSRRLRKLLLPPPWKRRRWRLLRKRWLARKLLQKLMMKSKLELAARKKQLDSRVVNQYNSSFLLRKKKTLLAYFSVNFNTFFISYARVFCQPPSFLSSPPSPPLAPSHHFLCTPLPHPPQVLNHVFLWGIRAIFLATSS